MNLRVGTFAWPLGVCASALLACSSFDASGTPADSAHAGGNESANPSSVVPAGCDLTKSPKESPACVDERVGVFASPAGDDTAPGTRC